LGIAEGGQWIQRSALDGDSIAWLVLTVPPPVSSVRRQSPPSAG